MVDFLNNPNAGIIVLLVAMGFSFAIGTHAFIVAMATKYYFKKDNVFNKANYNYGGIFGTLKFSLFLEWLLLLVTVSFVFWMFYTFVALTNDNFNFIFITYFFILCIGIILGFNARLDGLMNITIRSGGGGDFFGGIMLVWKKEKSYDRFIYNILLIFTVLLILLGMFYYLYSYKINIYG